MKAMKHMFYSIIGENLSYAAQELQSWHDNVIFLRKELKNCEVRYAICFILQNKSTMIKVTKETSIYY